ncbi:fido domain-containing protein [Rhizophagus irregularis DAOM 181602=DAOM 197198]|nr:fido domain-containing protein [Rhizophagus irregularis DAOM 181602=DAOM 197198]
MNEKEVTRRKFKMIHSNFEILNKPWWKKCISSECDVDLTIEFVQQQLKKPDRSLRLVKKVQNLNDAITSIFPSKFFPKLSIDNFTPLLAKQLNQHICNVLIDDAGQYRIKYVMPAQENFVYMSPYLIEDRMNELFRQCREKFKKEDLQLEEAVKFGAMILEDVVKKFLWKFREQIYPVEYYAINIGAWEKDKNALEYHAHFHLHLDKVIVHNMEQKKG